MSARAYNRHQSEKAMKRARSYAVGHCWNIPEHDTRVIEKYAHKLRDNPAKCSCSACCNKRRSNIFKPQEKLTMQERRAQLNT